SRLRDPFYFPTRRSSDLACADWRTCGIGIRVCEFGFAKVFCDQNRVGTRSVEIRVNGEGRRTGYGYTVQKPLIGIVGIIYLKQRSEEHTSELQSRENIVC